MLDRGLEFLEIFPRFKEKGPRYIFYPMVLIGFSSVTDRIDQHDNPSFDYQHAKPSKVLREFLFSLFLCLIANAFVHLFIHSVQTAGIL